MAVEPRLADEDAQLFAELLPRGPHAVADGDEVGRAAVGDADRAGDARRGAELAEDLAQGLRAGGEFGRQLLAEVDELAEVVLPLPDEPAATRSWGMDVEVIRKVLVKGR